MRRQFIARRAAVGFGELCYYRFVMSNEIGPTLKVVIWSPYVKDIIQSTCMYQAGSIGLTAFSNLAVSRTSVLMNFLVRSSWVAIGATFAAMIGAGILAQSILIGYYILLRWCSSGFSDDIRWAFSHQSCVVHGRHCGRSLPCGHMCTQ